MYYVMKRKLFYLPAIFAFMAAIVIINACNEENLALDPFSQTELAYFNDQDAFERGIRGVYAKLTDFYWFNANNPNHEVWLLPGDDLTTDGDFPTEHFATLAPGNGRINYIYDKCYDLVGRSNAMLEKIETIGADIYEDPDLMDYNTGEALFLRSWANYFLFVFWEKAPLITERIQGVGEETKQPESEGTQLLDQAIADLTEAAGLLPESWDAEFAGRVTKDAANGLLGRVYMVRAAYGGGNADYSAAITAFNKITTRELAPKFGDNFDGNKENNIESLFEFQASNVPGFENIWLGNEFNQTIGSMHAYWGFFNDTWSFWAHDPFEPTEKLRNTFEAGDPRIDETFRPNDGNNFNGWEFIKYTKRDAPGKNTTSLNNPRILRYADVLLLKAEAIVRTGGNTTDAIELVNEIRTRARNSVPDTIPVSSVPADYDTGETNTETVLEWIKKERFMELAGEESHRWVDIKRWHKEGELTVNNEFFSSMRPDIAFDPNVHFRYPIPNNEVDLNPNVFQNEGY